MKVYIVTDCDDELVANEAYTSILEAQRMIVNTILEGTNTFTFDCKYRALSNRYVVDIKTNGTEESQYFIQELTVIGEQE